MLHSILPGLALLGTLAVGVPATWTLALLPAARLEAARLALVATIIPAAAVAVWPAQLPPALSRPLAPIAGLMIARGWPPLHLILGALPMLLLPLARTLARLPAGQRRAGRGLGAGPVAMLRLVWLPQLGAPLLLGAALAALLDLVATLPYPGGSP